MRKLFFYINLCASLVFCGPILQAAPKPAVAPISWELKFRFQDPQKVSVVVPGQSQPEVYWYMLYSVENQGDREVDFYPHFQLVTDTLQVIRSEIQVSPEAFRAIKRRSGDPLLVTPTKVMGRLLRGKDRAKHCVAIWRDFDFKAKGFKIYVRGLSGETIRLKNPVFDPKKPESEKNKRYFTLRKTLEIPYKFPGGLQMRTLAKPERIASDQRWVMR